MSEDLLRFRVSNLAARVAEGVPIQWRGREFASGPLLVELDRESGPESSRGVLDYGRRRARAEFHVRLTFPEFAEVLDGLGADAELTRPVRAVLRSEGEIQDDHGFVLSGTCELHPHALLPREKTAAAVLPGQ